MLKRRSKSFIPRRFFDHSPLLLYPHKAFYYFVFFTIKLVRRNILIESLIQIIYKERNRDNRDRDEKE